MINTSNSHSGSAHEAQGGTQDPRYLVAKPLFACHRRQNPILLSEERFVVLQRAGKKRFKLQRETVIPSTGTGTGTGIFTTSVGRGSAAEALSICVETVSAWEPASTTQSVE